MTNSRMITAGSINMSVSARENGRTPVSLTRQKRNAALTVPDIKSEKRVERASTRCTAPARTPIHSIINAGRRICPPNIPFPSSGSSCSLRYASSSRASSSGSSSSSLSEYLSILLSEISAVFPTSPASSDAAATDIAILSPQIGSSLSFISLSVLTLQVTVVSGISASTDSGAFAPFCV